MVKVKEGSTDRERKAPESFFQKVALLVVGFALTTAAGGYLSDRYQRENTRMQLEIAAMQSDLTRSYQAFETISQLMDRRLFRMRRMLDVFDGSVGADAHDQRLADYRMVLVEWNENLNRNRAFYEYYFAVDKPQQSSTNSCSDSFEAITYQFNSAHEQLQKLISKKPDGSVDKVKAELDGLGPCVFFLDEKMLSHIKGLREVYKSRLNNRSYLQW